jgi:serine/threonine-protein kinase
MWKNMMEQRFIDSERKEARSGKYGDSSPEMAGSSRFKGVIRTMNDTSNHTFEIGTVLNEKWVILEFIGKGGMGEVYRAHQLNLNRDVAIKVISNEFVKSLEGDTEGMNLSLDRFRREVQTMAQVRHPNVLQIFDQGSVTVNKSDEEVAIEYIAMEYIPGGSLRSTMSEEGFYPDEGRVREWLQAYFLPLLDGVQAMHEAGIIHRDLKPENVLLDGRIPKIADFGLARSNRLKPFTQSMDMRGTPPYMSPEHFFDLKRTDERTDVYALGKILFEAVSGKMKPDQIPFRQASLAGTETSFLQALDRIIREATAEERDERTVSVETLDQALTEALKGGENEASSLENIQTTRKRNLRSFFLIGGLALILAIAATFGFLAFHERGHGPADSSGAPSHALALGEVFEGEARQIPGNGPPPAESFHAKDGTTLRLVHGGRVTLREKGSEETGKTVDVAPFYIDETKVTNHQYVAFLNEVLPRIEVKNGVVRGDGRIWLLLGEVTKGCDPIGYRDGKFHVIESSHASCPVLRVTPYGAIAYTRFHGMRLPTEAEWLLALGKEERPKTPAVKGGTKEWLADGQCSIPETSLPSAQSEAESLPVCSPVGLFKANAHGLRGLNVGGEWGLKGGMPSSEEKSQLAEFVALGGYLNDGEGGDGRPAAIKRFPWEAFEEVGFRCVVSASISGA